MADGELKLSLPWPPSTNTYWRHNRGRTHISAKGLAFRELVSALYFAAGAPQAKGRIALVIEAYPPDHRARDLDNLLKATQDALTHAGMWRDDSDIDDLRVIRCNVLPPGKLVIRVRVLKA